jgi:hypothetical protein
MDCGCGGRYGSGCDGSGSDKGCDYGRGCGVGVCGFVSSYQRFDFLKHAFFFLHLSYYYNSDPYLYLNYGLDYVFSVDHRYIDGNRFFFHPYLSYQND